MGRVAASFSPTQWVDSTVSMSLWVHVGVKATRTPRATEWGQQLVGGGSTYVRWGRTVCPSVPGTTLVYSGWAGGSHYAHPGSGANYICLTQTPEYLSSTSTQEFHGLVYGAEYEANLNQPFGGVNNQDVPCAVCHVAQRSVLMIPGQITCPTGWTREYQGYLMTERYIYYRGTYECVDMSPEAIAGGKVSLDGALFYHVEAKCGSLACPPYDNARELTCVVCSI